MQMELSDFLIVGTAAFVAVGVLARMMNLKRQREMDRFEAELREIQQQQLAKQEQEQREKREREEAQEFLRKRAAVVNSEPTPVGDSQDPGLSDAGASDPRAREGKQASKPISRPAA